MTNLQTGWAVFLGANTATKLAREWRMERSSARRHLERAARHRIVRHRRRGVYEANSYYVNDEDGNV